MVQRFGVLLAAALVASPATRIRLTEPIGVARENEPVAVTLDGKQRWIFVTLRPRESKTFLLTAETIRKLRARDVLDIRPTDRVGFIVENKVFAADLSSQIYRDRPEDSGTLRTLTYKPVNVAMRRTPNRMHWAPSFQRTGARAYTSIATWDPVQKHNREERDHVLTFTREGSHAAYPEIALFAEYRFFPHMPYFSFRSTMTIEKPIEIFWLRNQEMTMDDLFTHVLWPSKDGSVNIAALEMRQRILDAAPLPADTPWVAFWHREQEFGLGAVVLDFQASKLVKAKTEISDGARNGKYWHRHLISQTPTPLAPGDRYSEHNVYVLFRTVDEFLTWQRKLRNPIKVEAVNP